MTHQDHSLLGVGIYTVPDAVWMTGVSAGRIRRWLKGYTFQVGEATHESPPVWSHDLPEIDGALALSFRDLIEVRFVDYFLRCGVSWKTLRSAAAHAAEIVKSTHPFATRHFKTDGRRIFAEFDQAQTGKSILDIVAKQYAISDTVAPHLYEGLEFESGHPARWFPARHGRLIVVDPAIAFGQPTVHPEGVPTSALVNAFNAEGSIDRVAYWFDVPKRAVQGAIEYQERHAA